MNCAACGFANAPGARFCAECGTPTDEVRPCPSCGATTHGGQKFCVDCGHRLIAPTGPTGPDPRSYTPAHLATQILTQRSAL